MLDDLRNRLRTAAFLAVASGIPVETMVADVSAVSNDKCHVSVASDGSVDIAVSETTQRRFRPEFTVLAALQKPNLALRYGTHGKNSQELRYHVPTWGRDKEIKIDPNLHVEDGFNPEIDRHYGPGRTANCFHAAPSVRTTANGFAEHATHVEWRFPEHPLFRLSAKVNLPAGNEYPKLVFKFVPKRSGWYSIGYTGSPESDPAAIDELWQPMVWQEKRFPTDSYLTLSFRCPLPTTLVTDQGATTGVLVDPSEFPFLQLPHYRKGSRFGVLLRNDEGMAQPILFAPVIGGGKSHMQAGQAYTFSMLLVVHTGGTLDTYEHIARNVFGFRDYRSNAICSLNATLENMIQYAMGPWSRFNDELRGCDYSTDAPGAVKNVSSLHPLGAALVADDEDIFRRRALPMIEYMMSREKFLFTTDPNQRKQSASMKMHGPAAPLSELTALDSISRHRSSIFLDAAKAMYGKDKVFNLDDVTRGDRWQNALAMYRATGQEQWLNKTIQMADEYLTKRIATRQTDFGDPDSEGMNFWPSLVPQWIELLELYETTNSQRYLDAAVTAARGYTQFVWMCPKIPDSEVLVNVGGKAPRYRRGDRFEDIELAEEEVPAWRVSAIGLTSEGPPTSPSHRGILNAHYAPFMLRVAHYAQNEFLHDVARSAVVGRYANFPGYHMNTERTTVYEKPDFPLREPHQLNGVTSLHFNHIWPHIALVIDYLVSDVFYRSQGRIDFPSQYSEGYAYLQSKVYGHRPGRIYDDDEVWLWMPRGLLRSSNLEINYVTARGKNGLYVILTNQSNREQTSELTIDPGFVSLRPSHAVRVWKQNRQTTPQELSHGQIRVAIDAKGITVLAVDDVVAEPRFQQKLQQATELRWRSPVAHLKLGDTTAMVISLGPELTSAYFYSRAMPQDFDAMTLRFEAGVRTGSISKTSFPFEFTVPLSKDESQLRFSIRAKRSDGSWVVSRAGRLAR